MSSPDPYNQHAQYRHPPQYHAQGQPRFAGLEDEPPSIPMKKSNPLVLAGVAGGAVLVLGVAAFSIFGGRHNEPSPQLSVSAVNQAAEEAQKAKAIREHLEITQRSLAKLQENQPSKAAPSKPAEPAATAEPAVAPVPATEATHPESQHASRTRPASAHPRPAPAPAPRATARAGSRVKIDSLDELGKGISSALGK